MPDPAPNAELLRSLGRLARGLSALFWGLPIALIVCVQTARAEWLRPLGVVPPLVATALLLFGLWQMGSFQKQERPWRSALDRARLLGLVNFFLCPFLYWWNKIPGHPFFTTVASVLVISALLFLLSLNLVIVRLGAMLPDETLRNEIKFFTVLNRVLLLTTLALAVIFFVSNRLPSPPSVLVFYLLLVERADAWLFVWLVLLPLAVFVLLPLAMTMALIWKTKEVILESVFGAAN